MDLKYFWLIIAVAAALLVVRALSALRSINKTRNLAAKPFLTKAETEALDHLESALPSCRIHAQVAMAALMKPKQGLDKRTHLQTRGYYSQKGIDFVAQDRSTGKIVALIELDDKIHNASCDTARDQLTAATGYFTIRLKLRWPTRTAVHRAIHDALGARSARTA